MVSAVLSSQGEKEVFPNTSLAEVGKFLKDTREKKRYTIDVINKITRIPKHHILSIESGERENLPEDLYLFGFIKKYARALGLNEKLELTSNEIREKLTDTCENPVIMILKNRQIRDKLQKGNKFVRGYHFYLLIGFFVFILSLYLVIYSSKPVGEAESTVVISSEPEIIQDKNVIEVKNDVKVVKKNNVHLAENIMLRPAVVIPN